MKKKILLGDIAISLEKILTESQDQKRIFGTFNPYDGSQCFTFIWLYS